MRDLIGSRLVELYYSQVHRLKALHADHHPGNYLFQDDGQIGLVDFGCVKRITFDYLGFDWVLCDAAVAARRESDTTHSKAHIRSGHPVSARLQDAFHT